jgi:roadblock/LC7 domain-containing protein
MNIQTGQVEETDEEFAIGLAHLQAFVAREGHSQVPPNHIEERITATEHTPGPWNYAKSDLGDGRYSIYANGPLAYSASEADYGEAAEANARLIAAAPALEEALALLADLVGGMNVDPVEGTTTIGGQYATTVVSALEAARVALEAAAPAATADA